MKTPHQIKVAIAAEIRKHLEEFDRTDSQMQYEYEVSLESEEQEFPYAKVFFRPYYLYMSDPKVIEDICVLEYQVFDENGAQQYPFVMPELEEFLTKEFRGE